MKLIFFNSLFLSGKHPPSCRSTNPTYPSPWESRGQITCNFSISSPDLNVYLRLTVSVECSKKSSKLPKISLFLYPGRWVFHLISSYCHHHPIDLHFRFESTGERMLVVYYRESTKIRGAFSHPPPIYKSASTSIVNSQSSRYFRCQRTCFSKSP